MMTRLVYWLEPSRRARRTTPGQLTVHTPYFRGEFGDADGGVAVAVDDAGAVDGKSKVD